MASRGGRIVERGGPRKSGSERGARRGGSARQGAPGGAHRSFWLLAAALGLTAVTLAALWRSLAGEAPPPLAEPEPAVAAAPLAPGPPAPPVRRVREPAAAPAEAEAAEAEREPALPELHFTLPAPGSEPSGIALFPPPGTDPPKRGLVVPEDFELPEGYVRHYQATDDGQELAPILMFHPDYEWVDESGAPIEIPADRVVPPELAPAGLPLQQLELPAPRPD